MMLSILIPTISGRKEMLEKLLQKFEEQISSDLVISKLIGIKRYAYNDVEILVYPNDELNLGTKRNILLQTAQGKYICFFDDDDSPAEDYIKILRAAMLEDVDVVSMRGIMTTNGKNPELFEHSLKYNEWKTTDSEIKYERYPNHLNCIRASIAKQITFPEKNFGEDHDWSKKLYESGLLKTEYYTDKVLYHYKFISNK